MKLASRKSALNPLPLLSHPHPPRPLLPPPPPPPRLPVVYFTNRSKAAVPVLVSLGCFVVYSTRRFVLSFAWCCFVLVFFSPLNFAMTSLGEERSNLSAFRTFVRFSLVWFCLFSLPLGVWEGLRFVVLALPGRFSYLF